jgi:hypothetical protein
MHDLTTVLQNQTLPNPGRKGDDIPDSSFVLGTEYKMANAM